MNSLLLACGLVCASQSKSSSGYTAFHASHELGASSDAVYAYSPFSSTFMLDPSRLRGAVLASADLQEFAQTQGC